MARFEVICLGSSVPYDPFLGAAWGTITFLDFWPPHEISSGRFKIVAPSGVDIRPGVLGAFPEFLPGPPTKVADKRVTVVDVVPTRTLSVSLFRVNDELRPDPWLDVSVVGCTLHVQHRGRRAAYELHALAGQGCLIVVRWSPSILSIEVQGSFQENRALSVAVGSSVSPQRISQEVTLGAVVAPKITSRTIDVALAVVVFTQRRDESYNEDQAQRISSELCEIVREFGVAGLEVGDHVAVPMLISVQHIDEGRLNAWSEASKHCAVGPPMLNAGLLCFPLLQPQADLAMGCLAYAFARRLDDWAGVEDKAFVPSIFASECDMRAQFWSAVSRGYFRVDSTSQSIVGELARRLAAPSQTSPAVELDVAQLDPLFESAGLDWLDKRVVRKKRRDSCATQMHVQRFLRRARNTASDAYAMFRKKINVRIEPESAGVIDLWIQAELLSMVVRQILSKSPALREDVRARLQKTGTESEKAEFELEAMAAFSGLGHDVAFIPCEDHRTPDLIAGGVYVECSRKDSHSVHVENARVLTEQVLELLVSRGAKCSRSVHLDLKFHVPYETSFQNDIISFAKTDRRECSARTTGWSATLREIGDWNQVWNRRELLVLAPDATWVYASGDSDTSWTPRHHFRHATLLSVTLDVARNLVKSIENTLRDKGKRRSQGGQIPDGAPAVCMISLGTVTDEIAEQVCEASPALVRRRSAVSALVVVWRKRVADDSVPKVVGLGAKSFRNAAASAPLPNGFALPHGPLMLIGLQMVKDGS